MNRMPLLVAGAVAVASTASLFVTEASYSGGFPLGVPWAVFGFLAVSSFATVIALSSGVARFSGHKISGLWRLFVGLMALSAWITIFVDQLPCFLGGTGC
jgi:hypothetical protein